MTASKALYRHEVVDSSEHCWIMKEDVRICTTDCEKDAKTVTDALNNYDTERTARLEAEAKIKTLEARLAEIQLILDKMIVAASIHHKESKDNSSLYSFLYEKILELKKLTGGTDDQAD